MQIKDKILNKIKSYKNKVDIIKYNLFNLFKKSMGIVGQSRKQQLIVSLTTYPMRFNVVYLTIESLMNQTVKPDKIILWLANDELKNGVVPLKIDKLQSRGLEIRIVHENLKSYKKLIYAIEEFKASIIITCDDDVIYPKTFIADLYNKSKQFPKHIIANRCAFIEKFSNKKLQPYLSWTSANNSNPSFNLFPTGIGGILYPSGSLNNKVLDKGATCKFNH